MVGLEVNLEDVSMDYDLRLDPKYYDFSVKNRFKLLNTSKYPLVKLRDLIKPDYYFFKYENGAIYKGLPTSAEYFDEDGEILKYDPVTNEEHPERIKYKARKGQILISSLKGAKAPVITFTDNYEDIVVSNGFYIFKVKENAPVIWKYVYYILKSTLLRNILDNHLSRGIGISAYKEHDLLRIEIPLPPKDIQEQLVSEIEKIEALINKEKLKLISLQDIIDDFFVRNSVKSEKFRKWEFEVFASDLLGIGKQKFLRCGAQYRAFWDVYDGLLFNGKTKYPIVKLGSLMRLDETKTLKKGVLDKEYILIELEDIEPKTGKIININRMITEIDSDKTYFDNADLITTKLRPYLGYTILNIPELDLIGTTELLPFKVNKEDTYPEYLKYILLSHEYLNKSQFLMYGKEHPRIHPLDLLNIKIPLPNLEIQNQIISDIQKQEKINDEAKQKLNEYRKSIDNSILEYLANLNSPLVSA